MTPSRWPGSRGSLHALATTLALALLALASSGCGVLLGLDEDATLIESKPVDQNTLLCAMLCDDGDPCTMDRCLSGNSGCSHSHVPDGPAPSEAQTAGDCQIIQCDAGAASRLADDTDRPDNTPCATGACVQGEPQMLPYDRGVLCPGGYCDGAGECSECLSDEHCKSPDTCGGAGEPGQCGCTAVTCSDLGLTCGSASDGCHALLDCNDGMMNGDETDIDCGGSLDSCKLRCALTRDCTYGTDCASGHCGGGNCTAPWSDGFGDDVTQHAHAIATDSDDNIIVAGAFAGTIRFGGQDLVAPNGEVHAYLSKLDAEGGHQWSHSYGGAGIVDIRDVATDGAGNVLVVGWLLGSMSIETTTLTSGPTEQGFVFKLDDQGFLLWARQLTATAGAGSSRALAVTVDTSNRIWVGGDAGGSVVIEGDALTSFDGTDALLLGFDAGGSIHFAQLFGPAGVQRITSLAAGPGGDVAAAGEFTGEIEFPPNAPLVSKGDFDGFAVRLDGAGVPIWWRGIGGSNEQHAVSIDFDVHGNVIVGGNFFGELDSGAALFPSAGGEDVFVMQLRASTGDTYWANVYGDLSADHLAAVATDLTGDVVATGHFGGSLSIGGSLLTSAGGNDVFLAKLDNNGGPLWGRRFGDSDAQLGVDLSATNTGSLCLTGDFRGSINFGQGAFASAGSDDVFVASLGPWP